MVIDNFKDTEVTSNRDFMLKAIAINPKTISNSSIELRSDRDFMLKAIAIDPSCVREIVGELKEDRDFMLKAININPEVASHMCDKQKNDPSFILEIVKLDTKNIKYASERLQREYEEYGQRALEEGFSDNPVMKNVKSLRENMISTLTTTGAKPEKP